MQERVQKIIANAGYCARRKAETLIEEGRVSVNGKIITIGDKASKTDDIRIDGVSLKPDKVRYFAFNKPKNVLTSLDDPSDLPEVTEYLQDIPERVFPVGRLDFDATGLIFLTNDGDWANRIMHPRYEVKKTYEVTLNKNAEKNLDKKLTGDIFLKDGKVTVHSVKLLSRKRVRLTIHSGKNHVIKRLIRKMGYFVEDLSRVKIGSIELGNLKPGQYRELSEQEVKSVQA